MVNMKSIEEKYIEKIREELPAHAEWVEIYGETIESILKEALAAQREEVLNIIKDEMLFSNDCNNCGRNMSVVFPAFDPLKEDSNIAFEKKYLKGKAQG